MKKKDYENRSIDIPIFNDDYKVVVCWGDSTFIEEVINREGMSDVDVPTTMTDKAGVTYSHPYCHPVIAIPAFPKTAHQIGTLAHEACHAVEAIFTKIGQKLGDEVFAHAVGAVVRLTLDAQKNAKQTSSKNSPSRESKITKRSPTKRKADRRADRQAVSSQDSPKVSTKRKPK